jgi:hypothetical protein
MREVVRKCRPVKARIGGRAYFYDDGYNNAIDDMAALARRYFRGRK